MIIQDTIEQPSCTSNEKFACGVATLVGLSCLISGTSAIQFAPGAYKALSLIAFCGPGEVATIGTYVTAKRVAEKYGLFTENNNNTPQNTDQTDYLTMR